jgi:hypothetical protein
MNSYTKTMNLANGLSIGNQERTIQLVKSSLSDIQQIILVVLSVNRWASNVDMFHLPPG